MKKRLIVCCDGTWQDLEASYPTNVVKTLQAICERGDDDVPQVAYYDAGVGSNAGDKLTGGAFGWGLSQNVLDAYRFLSSNYEDGDEIYLFGFSRGAYTVRSLGGLIRASGLLSRRYIRYTDEAYDLYRDRDIGADAPEAVAFRNEFGSEVRISFVGCWDTVGSLGVPDQISWLPFDDWINNRYQFHDMRVSTKAVLNARHAIAIDEHRKVFDVTHMEGPQVREVWFTGDHGAVGGGSFADRGLADVTLAWMLKEVQAIPGLDLKIDMTRVLTGVAPDPLGAFDNSVSPLFRFTGRRKREITGDFDHVSDAVKARWQADASYRPERLRQRFAEELDNWAANA